jgi:hypothetical protein
MSNIKLRTRATIAPNLPIAPVDYNQQYQDQLNNVHRLYYVQNDNANQQLVDQSYSQLTLYWLGGF